MELSKKLKIKKTLEQLTDINILLQIYNIISDVSTTNNNGTYFNLNKLTDDELNYIIDILKANYIRI